MKINNNRMNWMNENTPGIKNTTLHICEINASESSCKGTIKPEMHPTIMPEAAPKLFMAPIEPDISGGAISDT